MCFFIVYLLKIITNITKANTIIVSTTKPNKSRYIISNKIASINSTTSICLWTSFKFVLFSLETCKGCNFLSSPLFDNSLIKSLFIKSKYFLIIDCNLLKI